MKLKELVQQYAPRLNMDQKSVHVLAMMLRKKGLISQHGRGQHAAEMVPTDCTNLLLAALCGEKVREVADAVQKLRETELSAVYGTSDNNNTPNWIYFPHPVYKHLRREAYEHLPTELHGQNEPLSLGKALDAVFSAAGSACSIVYHFEIAIMPGIRLTDIIFLSENPDERLHVEFSTTMTHETHHNRFTRDGVSSNLFTCIGRAIAPEDVGPANRPLEMPKAVDELQGPHLHKGHLDSK